MNKLFLLILLVIPNFIYSQQSENQESDSVKIINHEIHMQKGIEQLLRKNQQIHFDKGGIKGFCVQIYSGDSYDKSKEVEDDFRKYFPEITSVRIKRVPPNWKVRVGKCRTKLEAKELQNKIKKMCPDASNPREIIIPFGEFD